MRRGDRSTQSVRCADTQHQRQEGSRGESRAQSAVRRLRVRPCLSRCPRLPSAQPTPAAERSCVLPPCPYRAPAPIRRMARTAPCHVTDVESGCSVSDPTPDSRGQTLRKCWVHAVFMRRKCPRSPLVCNPGLVQTSSSSSGSTQCGDVRHVVGAGAEVCGTWSTLHRLEGL